jgi:hypothetical protein
MIYKQLKLSITAALYVGEQKYEAVVKEYNLEPVNCFLLAYQ